MSKKRRSIHQESLLDKEYTLSFSTKNADMNGDVKVTVNGNLRDIKKYMGSIKNLEDKTEEYEAKAKAFDGVKELINAHDCAIEEESGLGHLFLLDLKSIMQYAESGESNVKK